ncbi:MAG: SufD family Fe-S cluster assembly protein [Gammaproteobacteria bacterium]|nr:SufD family Fe-S cluster assembly protein [Gammaproteobacteria bacterium]
MTKETFIPSSVELAGDFDSTAETTWLSNYRGKQRKLFGNKKFPTNKVEHFKYNRLDDFDVHDFLGIAKHEDKQIENYDLRLIDGIDASDNVDRLVFVNGQFSDSLSHIKHHNIISFADANTHQQKKIVDMLEGHDVSHNPFVLFNAAITENGILVEVDKKSPDAIIEIVTVLQDGAVNAASATQVLFDIADGAKCSSICRSISNNIKQEEAALSTIRAVINVGVEAEFTHYYLQLEDTHSLHFGSVEYNLQSSAKIDAFYAATGGRLKKIDITVNHLGQHAYAGLDGLYVAADNQQIDYHTTINHMLPNGTTNENFRGIINGDAKGVFNGRIYIAQDAQKTLAELSNKNLLMSDNATVHTKPELEIYADDVICAHGATVSRIDDASMYYLQARGIDKKEAELMLSLGFINELLLDLEHQEIADYIRPLLFQRVDIENSPITINKG